MRDARRAAAGREANDPRARSIQQGAPSAPRPAPTVDVRVGDVFGNARVVGHDVVTRGTAAGPGGANIQVPHDRYTLQLADGRRLSVTVPQTPPGGIPYGFDPMTNRHVNERRTILEAVGRTDPRVLAGASEVRVATSGMVYANTPEGPATTRTLGFFQSNSGTLQIAPDALHPQPTSVGTMQTRDILRHEGGHGVGYRLAPGTGYTPDFEAALGREGSTAYAQQFQGNARVREAYAEAHRLFQENPAAFRASHPAQAAIIERDLAAVSRGIAEGRMVGPLVSQGARNAAPAAAEAAARSAGARVLGGAARFLNHPLVAAGLVAAEVFTPTSLGGTRQQRPDIPEQPAIEARARELVSANPSLTYPDAVIAAARERGRTLPQRFVEELRTEARDQAEAYAAALDRTIRQAQQRENWRNRGRNVAG